MIIMKSEMFTGIEFEHTLDGVLFEKYEDSLVGQYFVDLDYLVDHLDELIQLRDVVIPHQMIPLPEVRAAMGERTVEDWEGKRKLNLKKEHGIYIWMELFDREISRSIPEMQEDDIRLALDIAKKYPEHKDIVIKEGENE